MSEPKRAKQLTTTLDDGGRSPQDRLQLKENGHDVRGQLAQNAQFKAQMMAQMKPRGGAVQRKQAPHEEGWEDAVREVAAGGLQVNTAQDACVVLRFVWPRETITLAHCEFSEAQDMAGAILKTLLDSSETIAALPRAAALTQVTKLWLATQLIARIYRSGGQGIANTSLTMVRGSYKIRPLLMRLNSGAFTSKRGL
ncbi:MAG: hypothetical protein ACI9U2_003569 [Bradymonadia bacterium]|jgi:hypothetical protein